MRARRVRPKSFEGHKTEFYGWLRKYTIRRKPYSNKEKRAWAIYLKGWKIILMERESSATVIQEGGNLKSMCTKKYDYASFLPSHNYDTAHKDLDIKHWD
jgi:hypothetical protein